MEVDNTIILYNDLLTKNKKLGMLMVKSIVFPLIISTVIGGIAGFLFGHFALKDVNKDKNPAEQVEAITKVPTFDFGGDFMLRGRWMTVSKQLTGNKLDLTLIKETGAVADTERAILHPDVILVAVIDKQSKNIKEMYIVSEFNQWQVALAYATIMFNVADLQHTEESLSTLIATLNIAQTVQNLSSNSLVVNGKKYYVSASKQVGLIFAVSANTQ